VPQGHGSFGHGRLGRRTNRELVCGRSRGHRLTHGETLARGPRQTG
jgi:hypothetical protein